MGRRYRKKGDDELLWALACGATLDSAAHKVGLSQRTAYRRLQDPVFRQRLQTLRSEMVERASGMLTAAGLEAVKTLLVLQNAATPAAVRLGAARLVLELGMKLRETTELTDRIAALEEQAESTT